MAAISVTEEVATIVALEKEQGMYSLSFRTSDPTIIEDALASLVYAGFMTDGDAKHLQALAVEAAAMGADGRR